jgi:hypothetical protein
MHLNVSVVSVGLFLRSMQLMALVCLLHTVRSDVPDSEDMPVHELFHKQPVSISLEQQQFAAALSGVLGMLRSLPAELTSMATQVSLLRALALHRESSQPNKLNEDEDTDEAKLQARCCYVCAGCMWPKRHAASNSRRPSSHMAPRAVGSLSHMASPQM